jgi:hypothetical protein
MNRDFTQGLSHGHKDGEDGNNDLPVRALKRLFKPDQLLPGAPNRHDEYRRGYVQGFEDETRVQIAASSIAAVATQLKNTDGSYAEPTTSTTLPTKETAMSTNDLRHQVPTNVHNVLSQQGGDTRRYSTHMQLLQETKQFLEAFQERLHSAGGAYQRFTDRLNNEGLMIDHLEPLVDNMEQTRQSINRLIEQIGTQDIPTVMREMDRIPQ